MSGKTWLLSGQFATPEVACITDQGGKRCISLAAEVCPTNVTSLSAEPPASLKQLVVARQRSYDPLWSPALS
jgi:hypothetical protein